MAKILVIEDEANIARAVRDKLAKEGHTVDPMPSGEDALAFLQTHRPDLILLDLLMPEMDGFEVLRRIKENEHTRRIPIVILSVLTDDERLDRLGIDGRITKPYKGADLLRVVRDVLARTEAGGSPP